MSYLDLMTDCRFCGGLAVVPVFVNTGAALLPAIVAVLASFAAILFKPRQLVRICREKPYWPIGILAGAVGVWLGIGWLAGGGPGQADGARPAASSPARMMEPDDWVQLARKLAASQVPAAASRQAPVEAPSGDRPLSLAGGNARCGYLGGPSPTDLTKLWAYTEKGAMFLSTPLVAGGRVYGACCILDPPVSFGTVVCLDAITGSRVWKAELKDASHDFKGFFSSPAMSADGKSLVIGQGLHPDYDSELVCLDAQTGKVKWLIDCPLHIESSPAIEGDIVVAGAGAVEDPDSHLPMSHKDQAKDKNPGYVFAARISTGKVIWKHVLNDPESSPAVENAVVYIGSGFNGNAVAALHLAETDEQLKAAGKSRQIWKTPTPFPATGAVTLTDELVLVGCGNGDYVFQAPDPAGAVMALDKRTGKVRWTLSMPDGVLGPIAVAGKTAIVPVRNGEIVAVNLAAKDDASRILWRAVPRQGSRILAGCALTETNVYAVTHDGHLVVMDAKTGKVLKSSYVNADPGEMGMSIASPMVAGGRVYVGSETGGLRCYGDGGNGN
jgi:outer membrane protein assembly factor BamB